ncbi:MAG: alpha/beta hydrolase [Hyphomonadaceae bacterium]|nr:alpha/beta hydrolase [Hyphomonadaceae bacterium]
MRRFRHDIGEGEIAGVEFGDPVKSFAALWLHATGFNAMTYQSILAPLGLRARVAALDLRGHGRTRLPASPGKLNSWARYRDDVIAWLDQQAPGGLVLGGHSMGATVALLVAGKRPDLVKGLVLVDPVILSPRQYMWMHLFPAAGWGLRAGHALARQARKRRSEFSSPQAAKKSYCGRGAFASWRSPFLDDYLLDGLERIDDNPLDSETQTWRLLCHPKWEAATFAAQRNRPWAALGRVRRRKIPITVLRAETGSVLSSKVVEKMVRKVPALIIKRKRGSSHFLPMEAPYDVRDALSSYLSRLFEGFTVAEEGPVRRSLRVGGQRYGG